MEDLLPGSEEELSIGDGHSQRRPEERGLEVGVAVAIVPCAFMAVVAAGRDEAVEEGGQIAFEAGFGDLSYFNRAFRRRFGGSPSDIRASVPASG